MISRRPKPPMNDSAKLADAENVSTGVRSIVVTKHVPSRHRARANDTCSSHSPLACKAFARLNDHMHFRGRLAGISIAQEGKNLVLNGRLPTFYLKQLIQTILMKVEGVERVVNQIEVINCSGLSSEGNETASKKET